MTTSDHPDLDSEWQRKGATLSDKTARRELGLTQDEIVQAIRREVEALVKTKHGDDYLKEQQARTELARIDRERNG